MGTLRFRSLRRRWRQLRLRLLTWVLRWFPRRRLTWAQFEARLTRADKLPWNAVLYRDPCTYCQRYHPEPTIEHVFPVGQRRFINRGPVDNKVGACRPCNQERGNTPLLLYLWIRQQPRRRDEGGRRVGVHRGQTRLFVAPHPAPLMVKLGDLVRWK